VGAWGPRPPARAASTTALPAKPAFVPPGPARIRPAPNRLSYSQLSAYSKCGYRFYLQRILGLPNVAPPPPEGEEQQPALDPRVRGSIVHRALEDIDFKDPQMPEIDYELTPHELDDIRSLVTAFARSPLCRRLAEAQSIRREAEFYFALEPDGSGPLVNGFVDVLAEEHDGTHLIVDYKTDRLPEDTTPAAYIERHYETQRLVYALAALRAGAHTAEVAYCLLERPEEPVQERYTQQDAPDLAHRLQTLAKGVLRHAYPVTETPHRELCGDCPGRAALCSHPETRTLRPPPDPWPGAPAPRSSPADSEPVAGPPLR
jgi:ATP-dependent exoDNAse (exonuclease V) beta subunit